MFAKVCTNQACRCSSDKSVVRMMLRPVGVASSPAGPAVSGRSTITGLDQWTGLVDWTSGLIEIVCKPPPGMNFDNVG